MPPTRESKPASAQPNIQDVFLNYARREKLPVHIRLMDGTDLEGDFAKAIAGHAVVGTDDEVAARLVDLVTTLPVDPLLIRPQWPTMDADETIATLNRLGKTVVPAVRSVTPHTSLPS